MKTVIRFDRDGLKGCLYTEAIDLRVVGPLFVARATEITFNGDTQQWDVHERGRGRCSIPTCRAASACGWEHENLQPALSIQLHKRSS